MHRPTREIKMDEWKELVDLAVDLAGSEDLMDTGERDGGRGWDGERKRVREGGGEERTSTSFPTGSSVDPTLLDKLEDVLCGYRKPSCFYSLRYQSH
jgi:hypothetical protein